MTRKEHNDMVDHVKIKFKVKTASDIKSHNEIIERKIYDLHRKYFKKIYSILINTPDQKVSKHEKDMITLYNLSEIMLDNNSAVFVDASFSFKRDNSYIWEQIKDIVSEGEHKETILENKIIPKKIQLKIKTMDCQEDYEKIRERITNDYFNDYMDDDLFDKNIIMLDTQALEKGLKIRITAKNFTKQKEYDQYYNRFLTIKGDKVFKYTKKRRNENIKKINERAEALGLETKPLI